MSPEKVSDAWDYSSAGVDCLTHRTLKNAKVVEPKLMIILFICVSIRYV